MKTKSRNKDTKKNFTFLIISLKIFFKKYLTLRTKGFGSGVFLMKKIEEVFGITIPLSSLIAHKQKMGKLFL